MMDWWANRKERRRLKRWEKYLKLTSKRMREDLHGIEQNQDPRLVREALERHGRG